MFLFLQFDCNYWCTLFESGLYYIFKNIALKSTTSFYLVHSLVQARQSSLQKIEMTIVFTENKTYYYFQNPFWPKNVGFYSHIFHMRWSSVYEIMPNFSKKKLPQISILVKHVLGDLHIPFPSPETCMVKNKQI